MNAETSQTVLPLSTYFTLLGHLLDTIVQSITADILSFSDITESESNRLDDLVKILHPLESLFVVESGQVSLSFCTVRRQAIGLKEMVVVS